LYTGITIETTSRLRVAPVSKMVDTFVGELNLFVLRLVAEHFDKWPGPIKACCGVLEFSPASLHSIRSNEDTSYDRLLLAECGIESQLVRGMLNAPAAKQASFKNSPMRRGCK
jgi:hypothetical protein